MQVPRAPPALTWSCRYTGWKLYSYCKSSASWRVRIALAIKGIKYDYHAVNLLAGAQKEMG